ncbi:MAG: hypothetical protein MO846_08925 [Candidatus Devosia symbiotica]|nr:hypothetical protein [Candidatus Devosia symbiotica]
MIETPNWTPDGQTLIFNADGELWRIATSGGIPVKINTGDLRDLNNDHMLSPDGETVYVSSDDGHLYAVPVASGTPRRVYNAYATPHHHYPHRINPDGLTLAYVAVEAPHGNRRINIFTILATGRPDTRHRAIDR